MDKKTLVIIPTYNEAENILKLIMEIFWLDLPVDVLVVDDNSPDGTGQLIKRNLARYDGRLHLIQRKGKMGLGTAYVAGFKFAIRKRYDYIFEMDADFSHDPQEIPHFIEKMGDYAVVIGSRYVGGVRVINWPLRRLILSVGASIYTRLVTGLPLKDQTTGFKCFRRGVLEALDLDGIRSGGYSFQIEMNFRAWKKGFRIGEIPIIFTDRQVGHSKMSKKIIREAVLMVWKLKIRSLLGRL
ncbi:polyprenol monophosphomannose synthase [candidate division KSB1 bacterium]|nr:polyprenol monophosphomannose synthase [candidate division KSB1 bacterium]